MLFRSYMFNNASSITSLAFGSDFNTTTVTNMNHMFNGMSSLTSLTFGSNTNAIDIGAAAFAGAKLNNLTLYNSVTYLDGVSLDYTSISEFISSYSGNMNDIYAPMGAFGYSSITNLTIQKTGTYRTIELNNNNELKIDLENEMLYTLDLRNIEVEQQTGIQNSIFKVTGPNYEDGITIVTDSNGHAYLKNMVIDKLYHIEQTLSNGYTKVIPFDIKIGRNPETNEVRIFTYQKPTSLSVEDCDSVFTFDSSTNSLTSETDGTALGANFKCNVVLDLREYDGTLTVGGAAVFKDKMTTASNPSLNLSVVKNEKSVSATPFLSMTKSSSSGAWSQTSRSFTTNKAYEKDGTSYKQIDLTGGSKYYLLVDYTRGTENASSSSKPLANVNNINVTAGLRYSNEVSNVKPLGNPNVVENLRNYGLNDANNPILEVVVTNKYIEKAYLSITKLDGKTDTPLSGAQYRIKGPGLPANGKYVTIDDNGKATVELYLSFSGCLGCIAGYDGSYPTNNQYTIEEVIAPEGYSLDNKPITFKLNANLIAGMTTTREYSLEYSNVETNGKFSSIDINNETKTWNVTLEDYPIVTIKKTDGETGSLLPNTYYAIYVSTRDSGYETLEYAKDANGNYIGEQLIIDGEKYYVVKTDENGEIHLSLPGGNYKLIEIQAADDKYEIDGQEINFSIGESLPYQAAGASLVNGGLVVGGPVNGVSSNVYATSDGGHLVITMGTPDGNYSGNLYLIKYDSDYHAKWVRSYTRYNDLEEYRSYFDDPDRLEYISTISSSYSSTYWDGFIFKELDDGYYIIGQDNDIIRINKNTGVDEFHSNIAKPRKVIAEYDKLCDIPSGKTTANYPSYELKDGDTEHYYCTGSSSSSYYINDFTASVPNVVSFITDEGKIYTLYTPNNKTKFELKDGTILPEVSSGTGIYLLEFNKTGDLLSVKDFTSVLTSGKQQLIDTGYDDLENQVKTVLSNSYHDVVIESIEPVNSSYINTYWHSRFKVLDNGDFVFANAEVISVSLVIMSSTPEI